MIFFLPILENIESNIDKLWSNYKKRYDITYNSTTEELHRFKIFANNVKIIIKHNVEQDLGLHTYRLGINKFSIFTNEEFSEKFKGYKYEKNCRSELSDIRRSYIPIPPYITLPVSIDWRDHDIVTSVKDQQECGACWAFSATGALESHHARVTGELIGLSEQQLIDCSTQYGNHGCNGGSMDNAFSYVYYNKGLADEGSYLYVRTNETACKFSRESVATTCDGFVDIPEGNETALQEALALQGPVSVGINSRLLQHYRSGVISHAECSSKVHDLDHALLVVGYDIANDPIYGQQEYYIVKNSWGTTWGENGYVKFARNKNNMCGISTAASYPIVKGSSIKAEVTID